MCHMRVGASGRNQGVQRGVADACALGGAKGACRGVVLCMLVVARANALRSARQMQTLQTTFICLSLSTEGASYMVGCGLMSSIQPCMRGTPRTDDATAKWFATRVWLGTRGGEVEGSAPPNLRPTATGVEGDPRPNLRLERSGRRVADRYVS